MRPAERAAAIARAAAPVLALSVVFVAQLPTLLRPLLDGDEAVYAAIASLVNTGAPLYAAGGVDNKPPGIFWMYAAAFRLAGGYDMLAVHAVKVGIVLATAAVLALIARRCTRSRWAALLAFAAYPLITQLGDARMPAANTEALMGLPIAVAVLLLLHRRIALAGAMVAVAILAKQVAVFDLAVLVAGAWLLGGNRSARLRNLGAALAGFSVALAGTAVLLGLQGSLVGAVRWTALTLASYGAQAWDPGQVVQRAYHGFGPWFKAGLALWLGALPTLAWLRRDRAPELRIVWAWMAASLLGAAAGGQFFPHYLVQPAAPLAVLAAAGISGLVIHRGAPWRGVLAAALILALIPAALALSTIYLAPPVAPGRPDFRTVGAYVQAITAPGDRIQVYGADAAYYVGAARIPATRFVLFLRGFPRASGRTPLNWDTSPDVWPLLQRDWQAHPPALVLDTSTANDDFQAYPLTTFPVVGDLVARDYTRVAVVEGITIYRRRPGA